MHIHINIYIYIYIFTHILFCTVGTNCGRSPETHFTHDFVKFTQQLCSPPWICWFVPIYHPVSLWLVPGPKVVRPKFGAHGRQVLTISSELHARGKTNFLLIYTYKADGNTHNKHKSLEFNGIAIFRVDLFLGSVVRKCVLPKGLAKELPKMLKIEMFASDRLHSGFNFSTC